MALTLVETAKAYSGDTLRSSLIQKFAETSDLMRVLPFMNIPGASYSYNLEETLPTMAFRGINSSYSESTGVINPQTESLKIVGGDIDVDTALVDMFGMERRTTQEMMAVKAASLLWTKKFFKGDTSTATTGKLEFDGLENRLTGSQVVTQSAGGLSLAKLDETIDQVENPTHICMNKNLRRRLSAAARLSTVGGYVTYNLDEFGRQVMYYNDLPIVIVDKDETNTAILGFTETSTTSSIYVCSFSDEGVVGIQNGDIKVKDLGEIDSSPVYRTRLEWLSAFCVLGPYSAARYSMITDVAAVV